MSPGSRAQGPGLSGGGQVGDMLRQPNFVVLSPGDPSKNCLRRYYFGGSFDSRGRNERLDRVRLGLRQAPAIELQAGAPVEEVR